MNSFKGLLYKNPWQPRSTRSQRLRTLKF